MARQDGTTNYQDLQQLKDKIMSWLSNAPRQPKPKAEPPVSIPVPDQREQVFHDTVPIEEEKLPQAREKAEWQNMRVLAFFERYKDERWTPAEVHSLLLGEDAQNGKRELILLTSVRRSITNLTKKERLIKCQYSESRKGRYGALNRTWRYNPDWTPPLNPKK